MSKTERELLFKKVKIAKDAMQSIVLLGVNRYQFKGKITQHIGKLVKIHEDLEKEMNRLNKGEYDL